MNYVLRFHMTSGQHFDEIRTVSEGRTFEDVTSSVDGMLEMLRYDNTYIGTNRVYLTSAIAAIEVLDTAAVSRNPLRRLAARFR